MIQVLVKSWLATALVIALALSAQGAVVDVSGVITGDTVWTRADTIRVLDTVVVSSQGHLTVEPGTVVLFGDWAALNLAGRLEAGADGDRRTVFTSEREARGETPTPADWRGIYPLSGSSASFVNCDIRWAASGVVATRSDLAMTGCRVTGFRYVGVKSVGTTTLSPTVLTIDNCVIQGDTVGSIRANYGLMVTYEVVASITASVFAYCNYGVFLQASSSHGPQFEIERSEVFGNALRGIYVYGGG